MSTLKETVEKAVINLHNKTNKEWISLKEIYEEVERIRNIPNANNGASIRATLEMHCALSDAFSGKEIYILKEKGSGLYKHIYYRNLRMINDMNIGDIFTREELMYIFKISGQSGIMKTNTLNCLVLTTSENNGVYVDSSVDNGFIQYTGEGLTGDQTITKNNKTLYNSKKNNLPVYLFSKDKNKRYIFEGRVELYDEPYQVQEKDVNHNDRLVWKFPLKIIYPEAYNDQNDEKFSKVSYEINIIEDSLDFGNLDYDLEFVDGPLNIRKYRRMGNKSTRSRKPDYIAQEIIKNKQGIINEKIVYENEVKRLMEEDAEEQVRLMEEFFKNKKENEGFDILSFELNSDGQYVEKYIEVKSTKGGEGTPIDITSDEIEFAKNHIDNYYLYRIINSERENRYVKVVRGEQLLNDYNFVPTTYKIFSS